MIFIVYSQISEENLKSSLGMPEYSYFFVLKGFLPVLRELGEVVIVNHPENEVDAIYDAYQKKGEQCLFITFSPPNKSPVDLRCPTISVIAWEFDPVPNEVWDSNLKNDWHYVLSNHGCALSLSKYSAKAIKDLMGERFPVIAIPTPVWDNFATLRRKTRNALNLAQSELSISGNIVDSRNYYITPDRFEVLNPLDRFQLKNWSGQTLQMGFSRTDEFSAYLGGFYKSETWGTWSRISNPWILIPYHLTGTLNLKIIARGYGPNVNREIYISIGDERKKICLQDEFTEISVSFCLKHPDNILRFFDLDLTPVPGARDPRFMGIGLRYIELTGCSLRVNDPAIEYTPIQVHKTSIEGVVYTSVFSPLDGRKNWQDIVTAFCSAFQEVEDATLVMKMSHHSLSSFLGKLHFFLQQLAPFKCRVIALHGYMDPSEYENLISITHFYVNASRCEGLCLPLMEFMACCKPSIAPMHTAMTDYVTSFSSFVVDSSLEPCMWPHDSRNVFRAMRYRINWESLVRAYQKSYDIAKNDNNKYKAMADAASSQIKNFASNQVVKDKLTGFFSQKIKYDLKRFPTEALRPEI